MGPCKQCASKSLRAAGKSSATLLKQLGHQTCPAGLMTCADAGAVVSVKIFVKQNVIPPVRIRLKLFRSTINGTAAVLSAEKNPGHAARVLPGHLPQRVHLARTSGAFDFNARAVIMM